MLLRDHRASTSRKRQCGKRRHAVIKLGEQRWGQPCFSAPTELIGDGEERFGLELLVCVVARLLFRSPVVDAALFPAFATSFDLRFSNGGETSLSPGRRRRHRRTECLRGDR